MTAPIFALEERLRLAMMASDVDELSALLSPKLIFTTFLGDVITKQDDLDAHASGLLTMHSVEISEQNLQSAGAATLVTCLAEIDATFDGERSRKQFRFTRVWAPEEDGIQRLVAGQATLVYASLLSD